MFTNLSSMNTLQGKHIILVRHFLLFAVQCPLTQPSPPLPSAQSLIFMYESRYHQCCLCLNTGAHPAINSHGKNTELCIYLFMNHTLTYFQEKNTFLADQHTNCGLTYQCQYYTVSLSEPLRVPNCNHLSPM